jgi:hypothetical protein
MNPFKYLTGPVKPEADASVQIGTPEAPLDRPRLKLVDGEIRDAGKVLTGPQARDSWQKISRAWSAKPEADRDAEAFLPRDARYARRVAKRARARQMRKDQRRFVQREWARETAARDLLNLFLLADGAEPASPLHRYRAQERIARRVAYIRGERQAQYDQQIAARQKDRTLPAPAPIPSHDEIRAELWRLASTATLPKPKVRKVPATGLFDGPSFPDALTQHRVGQ